MGLVRGFGGRNDVFVERSYELRVQCFVVGLNGTTERQKG